MEGLLVDEDGEILLSQSNKNIEILTQNKSEKLKNELSVSDVESVKSKNENLMQERVSMNLQRSDSS